MNRLFLAENTDFGSLLDGEMLLRLPASMRVDMSKAPHRALSAVGQLIVRCAACETLGLSNRELRFAANRWGKPGLDMAADFHYNISHTGGAVLVGVSRHPVGVDIEFPREPKYQIMKRFFTEGEQAYVTGGESATDKRFLEIWTRKEAYVKALGKGLTLSLSSFDVTKPPVSDAIETSLHGGYTISCCCFEDPHWLAPHPISWELLVAMASLLEPID